MNLIVIGVNHQTAPVEVREQFTISEARLPEALKTLAAQPGIEEAMIVSTCNRVELIARTKDADANLDGCLKKMYGVDAQSYRKYLYEYRERDAIRHVFRVASSLDSMVVGEPQILGQVKEAYATARAVGALNSQLDALYSRAFAVAKRVRTETAIATSAVSIASVAVELAQKIFGNLEGKSVYLVGAGKMCELAARHLLAPGGYGVGECFGHGRVLRWWATGQQAFLADPRVTSELPASEGEPRSAHGGEVSEHCKPTLPIEDRHRLTVSHYLHT